MKNFIKLKSKSGHVSYVNILSIIAVNAISETSTQLILTGDYLPQSSKSDFKNGLLLEIPVDDVVAMIEEAQRDHH